MASRVRKLDATLGLGPFSAFVLELEVKLGFLPLDTGRGGAAFGGSLPALLASHVCAVGKDVILH